MDQERLLVVIVTRDRPTLTKRLLDSISGVHISPLTVILVDDSIASSSREQNRQIANRALYPCHYVGHSEAAALQDRYLSSRVCSGSLKFWMLGQAGWNAGAARNVGILAALGHESRTVLCLDDDVVLRAGIAGLRRVLLQEVCFGSITNCPDVGQATWLEWYAEVQSVGQSNSCREGEVELQRALLLNYTDADVCEGDNRTLGVDRALQSSVRSGTVYAYRISADSIPLFPLLHSEDQIWFDRCEAGGIRLRHSPIPVEHHRLPRKLLNADLLLTEETGFACRRALEICRRDPKRALRGTVRAIAVMRSRSLWVLARRIGRLPQADNTSIEVSIGEAIERVALHLKSNDSIEQMCDSSSDYIAAEQRWAMCRQLLVGRRRPKAISLER